MRVVGLLLAIVAHAAPAWAEDEAKKGEPAPVEVVRDLTLLPPGRYRMVQTWEQRGEETSERRGQEPETKAVEASNRFTFAVEVAPSKADRARAEEIRVTVKRVEIRTSDVPPPGSYDSAGPPAKQAEILHRQFHGLVGGTSRVGAGAFSDGEGFSGLGAVWDRFAEDHPDLTHMADANRRNYGDPRLDRMFAHGLDVLYGPDAGRAKGRARALRRGEAFTVVAEKPGIGMKPTAVEHACTVTTTGREVVVRAEWKINGFDPQTDGGGLVVRGGDIRGVATLTFLARGGLLTRREETVERTDQVAPGPAPGVSQWTRRVTEKSTFSLVKQ